MDINGDVDTLKWIIGKLNESRAKMGDVYDLNELQGEIDDIKALRRTAETLGEAATELAEAIKARTQALLKHPQRFEVFYERRRKPDDARYVDYVAGVRIWLDDVPDEKQTPYEDPEYLMNYVATGDPMAGYEYAKHLAEKFKTKVVYKGWGKSHTKFFEMLENNVPPAYAWAATIPNAMPGKKKKFGE